MLNLSRFARFSWGKIWFGGFAPCKRFDILQLCISKNPPVSKKMWTYQSIHQGEACRDKVWKLHQPQKSTSAEMEVMYGDEWGYLLIPMETVSPFPNTVNLWVGKSGSRLFLLLKAEKYLILWFLLQGQIFWIPSFPTKNNEEHQIIPQQYPLNSKICIFLCCA